MKRIILLSALCIFAGSGCSSDELSKNDQATLKNQFEKTKFDIKDVPPNEQARVQGFIDAQKRMVAAGKSPGDGH